MAEELWRLEQDLKLEEEELRKTLASEQLSEEAELKAKKAKFLTDLEAKIKEEEEEEEARLMEGKQDRLRQLKQEVSPECS